MILNIGKITRSAITPVINGVLISLLLSGTSLAATPGIPFVENFSAANLKNSSKTTANWSVKRSALVQSFRNAQSGGLTSLTEGSDISGDIFSSKSMAVDDIDGDGDMDVIIGGSNGNDIHYYLNNGTSHPFENVTGVVIDSSGAYNEDLALGDVDSDGDLDLVVARKSYGYPAAAPAPNVIFFNNGSSTPFAGSAATPVSNDSYPSTSLVLVDMNADGYLDIVSGNSNTVNRIYINNTTSTPFTGAGSNISNDANNTTDIAVADFNNDGRPDVAVVNNRDSSNNLSVSKYYLNDGVGDLFDTSVSNDLSTHTFSGDDPSIAVGDLDSDGDIDIVGVGNSSAYIYYNMGGSNLFPDQTAFTSAQHRSLSVDVGDVDSDGDIDIVIGTYSGERNKLYLNNGTSTPFSDLSSIDLTADSLDTRKVILHDMDNDGDLDLVAANYGGINRLYINEHSNNPFNSLPGEGVTTDESDTNEIIFVDIDQDGDQDIVTANWNINKLYLNNGTNDPFNAVTAIDISKYFDANNPNGISYAVIAEDFDNDGDIDLAFGERSAIRSRLYLNDGSGNPFDTNPFVYQNIGTSLYDTNFTVSLTAGDVDNDGDIDLIASNAYATTTNGESTSTNKLYLNNGTSTPFTSAGVIIDPVNSDNDRTQTGVLIDINNDGYLDYVAGNSNATNKVYINNKTSNPFNGVASSYVGSGLNETTVSLRVGDINSDGLVDVVVANSSQDNRYYLNNGTNTPFQNVTSGVFLESVNQSKDSVIEDIDMDGDLDVLFANVGHNFLYLNNGTFDPFDSVQPIEISTDVGTFESLAVADVDNDGDKDLLSATFGVNSIYYNRAASESFIAIRENRIDTTAESTYSIAIADMDNDGDLDVVHGNNGVNRIYLNNNTAAPFLDAVSGDITTDNHITYDIAIADMNHDGFKDVIIANAGRNYLYLSDGIGNLFDTVTASPIGSESETETSWAVDIADINMDGHPDIVFGNASAVNRYYLNNGSSTPFDGVTSNTVDGSDSLTTFDIKATDINQDGYVDIITSNNGVNRLYLHSGGVTPYVNGSGVNISGDNAISYAIETGDVDRDGLPDLVVGNWSGINRLYLNDGSGNPFDFIAGTDISTESDNTISISLLDIDHDGDLDVVTPGYSGVDKYYLNDGTVNSDPFTSASGVLLAKDSTATYQAWDAAIGDVDGDGNQDVIIANKGESNRLIRSQPFDNTKNIAESLEVDTDIDILHATLTPNITIPNLTSVRWYMSNDGGQKYYSVKPGVEFTFPELGDDLRWKVELNSLTPLESPIVDTIGITARFDGDHDLVADDVDNCVNTGNADQLNTDSSFIGGDALGDACDDDDDADGVLDINDAFTLNPAESSDTDGDCPDYDLVTSGTGCGDASDPDIDGDGILNGSDPFNFNIEPTISGAPSTTATPDLLYNFVPVISDGGDGPGLTASLTFEGGSAANLPAWLSFNSSTGQLTGLPSNDDYITTFGNRDNVLENIVITVDDGVQTDALPAFNITIQDTRAPNTLAVPGGGYFNADVDARIFCLENVGSGCDTIRYTTDDAVAEAAFSSISTQTTTVSLDSSSDSINLRFYSVDIAGNIGTTKTETYNFDLEAPSVEIITPLQGEILTTLDSISGNLVDTQTATISGVQSLELQLSVIKSDGVHSVLSAGQDFSASPAAPKWFEVDLSGQTSGGNPWVNPWVSATAFDWSYAKGSIVWEHDHSYTLKARVTDVAGNVTESTRQFTYYVGGADSTTLTSNLVNQGILRNAPLYVEVDFGRDNQPIQQDISGTPIVLHVTLPDSSTVDIDLLTDVNGEASTTLGIGGANNLSFDTTGKYSIQAEFVGNAQMQPVVTAPFDVVVYDDELVDPVVEIITPSSTLLDELNMVVGSSSDSGSGIQKVEISIATVDGNGDDLFAGSDGLFDNLVPQWLPVVTANDYDDWTFAKGSINWITDQFYKIEARAVDWAGNTADSSQQFVFYAQGVAPAPTSLNLQQTAGALVTGSTVGAAVKLLRINAPSQNQTNQEVLLTITHPDSSTSSVNLITDAIGVASVTLGGGGVNNISFDTPGTYLMQASFAGNIQMAAADSGILQLVVYDEELVSPTISITTPGSELISSLGVISGSSEDIGGSGVKKVEIQITDGINSVTTVNGGLTAAQAVWLPTVYNEGTGGWGYNAGNVGWVDDAIYTLTVRATDYSGNVGQTSTSFTYYSNVTPADTTLTLTLNQSDVATNGLVEASIDFSRTSSTQDLSGTAVNLHFTDTSGGALPDLQVTTDASGNVTLELGTGAGNNPIFDTQGSYQIEASFAGTIQLKAVTSVAVDLYAFDTETDAPEINITAPVGGLLSSLAAVTGASSDNGAGVKSVEVQISDGFDAVVVAGADFSGVDSDPVWLPVSTVDDFANWSYARGAISWVSDTTYIINARATDFSGNITTASTSFTYYSGTPASTALDLILTSSVIPNNDQVDATLTFTRLNNTTQDQTGTELVLHITHPDGVTVTDINTVTNFAGQVTLALGTGEAGNISFDTPGRYLLEAEFSANIQMAGTTSELVSLLVGSSAGYAVIVQGKLPNESGIESHNKTANRIYNTLKDRGFVDEDIFYFNYDTSQIGVDFVPTKAAIQTVIESLNTQIETRPAPVYIIMVDHGGEVITGVSEASFYLGDEAITPSELDSWLSTLESNIASYDSLNNTDLLAENKRVVIVGSCYSGGFIPGVSASGRVVISSASAHEQSYKGPTEDDGIRVGEYFLEELFLELGDGSDLRTAFQGATSKTETWTRGGDLSANSANGYNDDAVQHPLLDDNADNQGTNALFSNSADGQLASEVVLGFDQDSLTNDAFIPADIVKVTDTLYLDNATSSAQLTLVANDPYQVNQAYVEIRTPDKTLSSTGNDTTEQLSNDYIRRAFTPPSISGAPYTLDYADFAQSGLYEIFYYVNDRFTGSLSPAKRSLVYKDRAAGGSANQPPSNFTLLSPGATSWNGTDTEKTILAFDWQDAVDTDIDSKVTYTLLVADDAGFSSFSRLNTSDICSAGSVVYKQEELTSSSTFIGEGDQLCDDWSYYWKVIAVDEYGQHTYSTDTFIFHTDNTNAQIGTIVAMVQSNVTSAQLTGANISNQFGESASEIAVVLYNGNYVILTSRVGESQVISTSLAGYTTPDISGITVADRATVEILISMDPAVDTDSDSDGVFDINDNCPTTPNADQTNSDSDAQGDACDLDDDDDGMSDVFEAAHGLDSTNPADASTDPDGDGASNLQEALNGTDPGVEDDVYFSDTDGDGVTDNRDNCIAIYNSDQTNTDGDAQGDACDSDDDDDGMPDTFEELYGLNSLIDDSALDLDIDGFSNFEEYGLGTNPVIKNNDTVDTDGDGITDFLDNCPADPNSGQDDLDNDTLGDICDPDRDGDQVENTVDLFPDNPAESTDNDLDGFGDNEDTDDDNDGMSDFFELLYGLDPLDGSDANSDGDDDGVTNLEEFGLGTNPNISNNTVIDTDTDGIIDVLDNCPQDSNVDQLDSDLDGQGDICDADRDNDGVVNSADVFPDDVNESVDTDGDGTGNNEDTDDDDDNITDAFELQYGMNPLDASDAGGDIDGDGVTNIDEFNNGTNPLLDNADSTDSDGDGTRDVEDNCPSLANPAQTDSDGDRQGDSCDSDDDNDGMPDIFETDNGFNALDAADAALDADGDGFTNLQEFYLNQDPNLSNAGGNDTDFDSVADNVDNCPSLSNSDQSDTDSDGVGNVCDDDDDGDGMPDTFELLYQLDPLSAADATLDADNDGISNLNEFLDSTSPRSSDLVPAAESSSGGGGVIPLFLLYGLLGLFWLRVAGMREGRFNIRP